MMSDTHRKSEDRAIQNTLFSSYEQPAIADARAQQDILLRQRLAEGPSYRIADIGCGDARHGVLLADVAELYHGFEIAPDIAAIARDNLANAGMAKGEIHEGDIGSYEWPQAFYDLVLCLYFTPGNFRDPYTDLDSYTNAYLDRNPAFVRVFAAAYQALSPGGRMFLTVYRDVPEAESAQHEFYLKTGQHPVTPRGSRFVATEERFWSVRFTQNSMRSNLSACGVADSCIVFHELNDIAWLVEVDR